MAIILRFCQYLGLRISYPDRERDITRLMQSGVSRSEAEDAVDTFIERELERDADIDRFLKDRLGLAEDQSHPPDTGFPSSDDEDGHSG